MMARALAIALCVALLLPPGSLLADPPEPGASDLPPKSEGEGRGFYGLLLGAAAGIAVGLGVAAASEYALKEGGAFGVMLLGGGLGGFVGHKVGSSAGRPWEDPSRLQISLDYALTTSAVSQDIQAAFEASGLPATNQHHPTAPSLSVTYGISGPFSAGVELSGIPGQWFRASDPGTYLTQLVSGQSYGVIVNYAPRPSEHRRLTYSLGAGLDYYSVTVESYFDPSFEGPYPEDQPFRASRSKDPTFGLQLRGGLEYALVHDVSLRVSLIGRWARPIEVPGIALTHPRPDLQRSLVAHSLDLSSVQVSVSVGMRF
jgi:hypothetical protein